MALSEIAKQLPRYFMQKTSLPYQLKDWLRKKSRLKKVFAGARFNHEDGLKIIGKDHWIHIRPSNTEPIIRIIAESKSQEYTSSLINNVKEVLTSNG
jgi:phosphomannomutase